MVKKTEHDHINLIQEKHTNKKHIATIIYKCHNDLDDWGRNHVWGKKIHLTTRLLPPSTSVLFPNTTNGKFSGSEGLAWWEIEKGKHLVSDPIDLEFPQMLMHC